MNLERDKFLTEAMGECWHETMLVADEEGGGAPFHICRKCKIGVYSKVDNNFSTWKGFGKLWEWAQKQDWWGDFRPTEMLKLHLCKDFAWCNPDTFANAIYSYLKEKDK